MTPRHGLLAAVLALAMTNLLDVRGAVGVLVSRGEVRRRDWPYSVLMRFRQIGQYSMPPT